MAKLGQKSVAMTDHGNIYGAVHFFDAAKKEGLLDYIRGDKFVPGGNLTRAEVFELLGKTSVIQGKIRNLLDFDKGY